MLRSGYDREQIDEALMKATFTVPEGELTAPVIVSNDPVDDLAADFTIGQQVEDSLVSDLTDEDRTYLCLKWGKTYRPDEWVRLEELYMQMINSYDIQAAGDINTLKLACKSSLKAN
jgi:hypothetical protein